MSNNAKLPPLMTGARARNPGLMSEGACVRCGRKLEETPTMLELDQRINEFHDFGGIPAEFSQGWFEFGSACAKALRKRARAVIVSYTPGPWRVGAEKSFVFLPGIVKPIMCGSQGNARLVAAAPELVVALRRLSVACAGTDEYLIARERQHANTMLAKVEP